MKLPRTTFKLSALALGVSLLCALPAHAIELDSGDSDTKIRLDFTPKYSMAYRTQDATDALKPGFPEPNENDGNLNFSKGLISNRADLLTEFDFGQRNWGVRISHAAWYDAMYLRGNANDGSKGVNNANNQEANEFVNATRNQHGRGDQIMDAFVYAKGSIGDMAASARIGRHALLYGESIFFGQNGVAAAQGPIDIATIASVPNWQFKEVLLPVEQLSGTLQVSDGVTLGGYYQFKWRPSKISGVGSYFSNQDYIGGNRVFFNGPPLLITDSDKDQTPGDSGQYGAQVRWAPAGGGYEYGFYAAQFHDKTPSALVFDPINGSARTVYAKNIKMLGASVNSSTGQLNWALEGSVRKDAPLASDPAVLAGAPFMPPSDCGGDVDNPCYAVGDTGHINISGIYVLNKSSLWDGGSVVAEVAWNRTLSVSKNPGTVGFGGLDPNSTRDASALRLLFEPQYFQVMPGLDISIPMGVGYNFGGRSSAMSNFAGGASSAGDWTVGVKGKYQDWNFGLNYTAFFGSAQTFTIADPSTTPTRMLSYGQTMADRNYLSFNLSRTF